MPLKFKAHIHKSIDKQFYSTLVSHSGEVIFTSETYKRKFLAISVIKEWFSKAEIIDKTKK